MKNLIKKIVLTMLFLGISYSYAQNKRVENKIDTLYTTEEKSNLQFWFDDAVNHMGISQVTKDEYYNILNTYSYKMSRLDDKDKDYTKEEIRVEFSKLLKKMNGKIKLILTKDQYITHLENFDKILHSVYTKAHWKPE